MAIIIYESETVFQFYKTMIDYLVLQRKTIESDELRIAINMNIILDCSCYLEGVLENRAKEVLNYYADLYRNVNIPEFEIRKPINTFFYALKDDCEQRISKCTGVDKYNEIFKLLLVNDLKSEPLIEKNMESIRVLGQLRNVIAHGREINAHILVTNREEMTGEETFNGGYKNAEDLLLKKEIISERFIEREDVGELFSDNTADYFLNITNEFVKGLDNYINENKKVVDIFDSLFPKKPND
jgi:hypothetical protein